MLLGSGASSATITVYDFTTGSKPSGWTENTLNSNFTTSWNADGNNYLIKGDAGNPLVSYPLRNNTAFQGDTLFQLSFYTGDVDCRDWGIAVSPNSYTSTNTSHWQWAWTTNTTRIAASNDCQTPNLYGLSAQAASDISGTSGIHGVTGWITMHFMVYTSSASTKLKVTQGDKDWDASDTQIGSVATISDRVVSNASTNYWVGISADNDHSSYAKANGFRISTDSSEFF